MGGPLPEDFDVFRDLRRLDAGVDDGVDLIVDGPLGERGGREEDDEQKFFHVVRRKRRSSTEGVRVTPPRERRPLPFTPPLRT